ncbi:MAG: NAD(P)/FAD-dependent oxidoreductase, partial [Arenibacterium sp.]
MPFETGAGAPRRIAVIGGGISGMGAANMLADTQQVTLFEAEPRLGGHARTVMAGRYGDQPVDTGFIVFNYVNYPHLVSLFDKLDVPVEKSSMTFGVSIDGGRLEYALTSLNALFAQRRNALRPGFQRMVRDIFRFNAKAAAAVAAKPGLTIGGLLLELNLGDWFRDYYLLPFSGAIWSTPKEKILDFPAHAMIRFFENHALLSHTGQHQWYTVKGGSVQYVSRLEAGMRRKGVDVRLGAAGPSVRPNGFAVENRCWGGGGGNFFESVIANPSGDSLRVLPDPSAPEKTALG